MSLDFKFNNSILNLGCARVIVSSVDTASDNLGDAISSLIF